MNPYLSRVKVSLQFSPWAGWVLDDYLNYSDSWFHFSQTGDRLWLSSSQRFSTFSGEVHKMFIVRSVRQFSHCMAAGFRNRMLPSSDDLARGRYHRLPCYTHPGDMILMTLCVVFSIVFSSFLTDKLMNTFTNLNTGSGMVPL